MNLILLSEKDFIGRNSVRLRDRRLKHVLEVHRGSAGADLKIGLLNGPVGRGKIIGLSSESLDMEVHFDAHAPEPLPVTLILALPRPKMLKRVLFAASSMGVKNIYLVNAFRVEKSFWQSPLLCRERMQEYLLLGLEQARDTIMPEVLLRPRFKPFVEDELPAKIITSLALIAHPGAEQPCPRSVQQHVTLAVGPEGGFIPYEVEKLASLGFLPVSLGERPLRVETVVPALLSRIF